eukprot:m.234068 g.234068  ORF g.234068 m.234068 type:complete len:212 (-) comp16032_c0_seq7:6-641(-)
MGVGASKIKAGEDRRAELQKKIEAKQAALKEKKETTKSLIEKTEKNHEEIKVAEKVKQDVEHGKIKTEEEQKQYAIAEAELKDKLKITKKEENVVLVEKEELQKENTTLREHFTQHKEVLDTNLREQEEMSTKIEQLNVQAIATREEAEALMNTVIDKLGGIPNGTAWASENADNPELQPLEASNAPIWTMKKGKPVALNLNDVIDQLPPW